MKRTIICIALVALWDFFFWDRPVGWTAGAYLLALAASVVLEGGSARLGRPAIAILGLLLGLVLALALEPGPLPAILGALGVVSLAMVLRGGWTTSVTSWACRWLAFLITGWVRLLGDVSLLGTRRRSRHKTSSARPPLRLIGKWGAPVFLSAVFLVLFAISNPLIQRWFERLGSRIESIWSDLWEFLDVWRLLTWLILALWIWALLRIRAWARVAAPAASASKGPDRFSPSAIVRCLLLFNLVFLIETVLDLRYLWAGAALPEGMTYAEYAHRGAYPLIATALLAALFVLVTFRPGSRSEREPWARRLVYLWIAQNVLLTFSSAYRLLLYIGEYHLTRWRLAAAIWMFLVAAGLLWISLRIILGRSGSWLLGANFLTAACVLYAASFVDFDGRIAWYNVRHCREVGGSGAKIDLDYLRELGKESLPAARWLSEKLRGTETGERVQALRGELEKELLEVLADWRGWSYLRSRLRAEP